MKILIIGDGNHQLIINWVKNLKQFQDYSVDVYSIKKIPDTSLSIYDSVYYARNMDRSNDGSFFKILYAWSIFFRLLCIKKRYDIIHIHLAKPQYLLLLPTIKLKSRKLVTSVWGTEFYRASNRMKRLLKPIYAQSDSIHCTNIALKKDFVVSNRISDDKVMVLPFFIDILQKIEAIRLNSGQCKTKLNWDSQKIQITIGYNYNEGQRHIDIFEELKFLSELKESIQLIIPLTYGTSLEYRDKVVQWVNQLPFCAITYLEFLSEEEIALTRLSSDIFLNLQVTDQYSAAFVESLYAGTIVITGSWLPYQNLKDEGVYFIEIDKITDLSKCLREVVSRIDFYKEQCQGNRKIIGKLFQNKPLADSWNTYFTNLLMSNK